MSLIHWFPLNGDIKDYGIDSFTISNTPSFNENGKIGKCATNSNLGVGRTYLTSQYLPLTKTSPISMFAWVYMNAYTQTDTASALNGLVSNHNHTPNSGNGSGFGLNLWNNGSSFKVAVSTASTNGRTWTTYRGNTAFYTGAWHHVGFTYNGSRINFYLDGNYDGGIDFTTSYDSNNQIGIFCWSTGYAQYVGDYKLNDVRIYNHALSKKEIKEISKGLVVHYNFEEGVDNLLKNTSRYMYSSKLSRTSEAKDGWFSIPLYCNSLISGKTYTLSVECDGLLNSVHSGSATNDPSKKLFTIWLYFHNTDYTDNDYSRYTIPICFTSSSYNHKQLSSTKHQWTFVLGTDIAYYKCCAVRVNTYSNGSTPITVNFWNFKLEENTTSTVWKPNKSDSQYTSLGYNIISDNSGNNFNGTINGNLAISSDTATGNHSMKFATDSYIDIPILPEFKQMTVSFWTKIPTADGGYRSLFNQKNNPTGSLWLSLNTESYGLWSYMSSSPSYSGAGNYIDANKWYFCTFVFDNGYANWYQNGVLLGRNVYYPNRLSIPSTHFCLGDSYGGSSWAGTPFDGWVADFKVYATALSAEDIKSEYQRKASIDKTGNLYTGLFVEDNSTEELLFGNQIGSDANFVFTGTGTLMNTDDSSLKLTDNIWTRTPKFKVVQGETLYYDITYSNDTAGNLIYFGFERFDDNGTSGENELCFYLIAESTTRNHYRIKGTLTVSGNSSAGNPITNWRVRILNKWTGSSASTGNFIIHHMSLRRASEIKSQKVLKAGIFKTNDLSEDAYNEKVSLYKNGFTGAKEFKEI